MKRINLSFMLSPQVALLEHRANPRVGREVGGAFFNCIHRTDIRLGSGWTDYLRLGVGSGRVQCQE